MKEEVKKVLDGSSKESLESSKGVVFIKQNEEYEYNAKQIIELDKAHENCSKKLAVLTKKDPFTIKKVIDRVFKSKEVKAAQAQKQKEIEQVETELESYRVNIGALASRNAELGQEIEEFVKFLAGLGLTPQDVISGYEFMLKELSKPKVKASEPKKVPEQKKGSRSAMERFNARMEKHIEMTQQQK